MATEIRVFDCLIPAGTTKAAPVTFDTSFPARNVDGLQIIAPDGSAGVVGWRLLVGGAVAIPYLSAAWVVTSGEVISWPLVGYPNSGAWSVQGYNTGVNDHTLYFRFLLSYIGAGSAAPAVIADDELSSAVLMG